MKSIKKRKGISLVALIITIIVLIIITGTVIITMNNGNIIGKSKEAVFKSDIANYREELSRNILNEQVKGNISGENQVNAAYKQENTKEQAKTDITDIRYWIPDITEDYINKLGVKNGDLYYVSNLKNEQEAKWAEELNIIDTSNMIAEKVNVGDYIEYIPGAGIIEKERTYNALPDETGYGYENEYLKEIPANPNQVFTVDGVTTEMWRVLSIDGENVSIVKEGLIYPNEKPNGLILYASTGYANAKIVLNSVCEIYKNATQSQGTRSINIDDINNLTQFTQQEIEAYGGGSTVKGGYGFENFSGKSTYYQYDGVDKLNDKSSNLYTMIFGNDNKEYWLASECINARTTINAFCTVNCISNGVVRGDELCHTDTSCKNEIAKFVRPVVILKPNLQVTGDGSIQNPWKIN